ncbi:NAD-dependent epimerase/dehydratase family protein [Salinactinospora qingdaonensis]|uniref:SDR family NAD(P)-dependent oxidoreductase n=1 Tax=Salinactinospora qingdaonensis TaxID=702744 RepID=A0ABP7FU76_9ACTN
MLVSVTGGTGFVGAHSVAALARAGHRVRLHVRDAANVERALAPLGVDSATVERVVVGDVTDEMSVAKAVRGTDAVLHAAAVYSFDSRYHSAMRRTNQRGAEVVLSAARRTGADPIIHVSSVAAMLPCAGRVLHEHTPPGAAREPYMASKAAAERVARDHQRQGAPVVITYPPALLGPHDPNLGDQNARLRDALRGLVPMWPSGGFPIGDVRDTAALHAAVLTAPRDGTDRHFGPGRYLSTRAYVRLLREVTGRPLPAAVLPAAAMLPVGLLADRLQRFWPWHLPAEYGAIYTCACAARVADHASTLGLVSRPPAQTVADTVHWLYQQGHVSARRAGRAAVPSSPVQV